MGGACSRKRDQLDNEDNLQRGISGRYSKSASSKWLATSFSRPAYELQRGNQRCPTLMELCIKKISEDLDKYSSFSMLPRDITQQIFNELVSSQRLTDASLEAFRDCALQDLHLGECPGVNNSWMDVISSQGISLLSVDLSGSDVTDSGLTQLNDCTNLQALNFNYCDQISDVGLNHIRGLSHLSSLSFRRNNSITSQGMSAFTSLVNLVKLDLERCPGIGGGLVHLKGLSKLESLNIKWCNCVTDADIKHLSGLTNLKGLQISCSKVTDLGISYLKGLHKLNLLNLEGCPVTASCLDSLSAVTALLYLNLSRCHLSDDGCEGFSKLGKLKVLNLGFNDISDACLVHLKGLTNLESLNLDSCRIDDEGLANLTGLRRLKSSPSLIKMAKSKSALLLVLCLALVSFHGSAANRQDQQLNECQLRSINAREPDDKIECEAGLVETWNPNHDQFQCVGVAVMRRTIQPKGLLLPTYSNAPSLIYIVQGKGMYGVMFSGCPETFQEAQQSRGSMGDQDQHQQIRRFRQGDIIALPAGVAHWAYNDGNEAVVAVTVLDTANAGNQLDNMPRNFYLAGNPENEFRQQYQRRPDQSRRPLFPSPRYSSRGRQSEKSSCNNLFCGMDSKMIAEAFNIDEQLARKLQSQNDFRGSIVRVEEQLQVVRPPRTQQEMQQMEREQCRPGGGCVANGAEETYCSMRLKENIADPSRADIFVPEVGRVSTVNGHNLPILQSIRMSASHVVLHCDAMRMPHWHLHAHSIMYCLEGQARVQIVDENGKNMFDGTFRKGQVLTVPQNFVVMKQAESERFEYVAFKTSAYTMTTDLAGRTSAFRAMPVEVIANAFQMSVEDAMKIKYGREETTLGMSRRQQSRRFSDVAAAAVATIAEVATSV